MIVYKIGNTWIQEGHMEFRAGSQRPTLTSSQEGSHPKALMDHVAMSRVVFAQTVR